MRRIGKFFGRTGLRVFLIVLSAALTLSLTTTASADDLTLSGQVTDETTSQPIENAKLTVTIGSFTSSRFPPTALDTIRLLCQLPITTTR
jgi:type 1 fimbria pilin